MKLSDLALRRAAYAFLALPVFVFLLGFLRWYLAVPLTLFLCVALLLAWRRPDGERKYLVLSRRGLLALFAVAAAWCFFAGLGNLYYQSDDWSARNAIFRDLITYRWPVIYPAKNAALVYYIGYWLPAALVGKLFLPLGEDVAFSAGNAALLVWSTLCICLVFLLLLIYLHTATRRACVLAVAVFIGFSGLDIIGTLCDVFFWGKEMPDHLEWWAFLFQYSSITTCLFWVFNQAVLAWVATLTFLNEKGLSNRVLLLSCTLCAAPFAAVGLALYMLGDFLFAVLCQKSFAAPLHSLCTPQNLIALFGITPVFCLYYATNLAVGMTGQGKARTPLWQWLLLLFAVILLACAAVLLYRRLQKKPRPVTLLWVATALIPLVAAFFTDRICPLYFSFLLLECGIYLLALLLLGRAEPLYYLTTLSLLLCPLFVIGTSADFSMRVSIPAVTVLCVMCIRALLDHGNALFQKPWSLRRAAVLLLAVALCIGAVTPLFELGRGIVAVCRAGELALVNDSIGSFAQIFSGGIGSTDKNFIAYGYADTFFFKFFAKGVG